MADKPLDLRNNLSPDNAETKIRKAARAVVLDREKQLIALIDVRDGEFYKIPGGGIEEGETEEQAASREAKEETGFDVDIQDNLGESQFMDDNPEYGPVIHHSVCFLAYKIGAESALEFNEYEQANKMKLIWVSFEEAIELFKNVKTEDRFSELINQRDFNYVLKAKEIIDKLQHS